jgi:catechol 2,3-dioxygenase-like lactoylglutathione lyase family enzyme
MKLRYALVFVSDMGRSVAFYRDVLGWPLAYQSPERTELAGEGTMLALHHASRPGGAAAVQGEIAGRCQLGFWVEDVEAFPNPASAVRNILLRAAAGGDLSRLDKCAPPMTLPATGPQAQKAHSPQIKEVRRKMARWAACWHGACPLTSGRGGKHGLASCAVRGGGSHPLGLLGRLQHSGACEPTLSRDYR